MDPNHNAKNNRYQILGGSSAASIGQYIFDPHLLVQAGVASELIRINDYASDALVLRLASHQTLQKLYKLDSPYRWNVSIVAISLMMVRCRLYAVNSRDTDWHIRAVLSYMSTVWFTSFHNHRAAGSYTLTMLANKRNMLLETIAILFLVPRSDVCQPRRTTSEPNEHTFSGWRSVKQNFDCSQLEGIQNKANIRNNAIFESNLVTSRSICTNSGYRSSYPEFVAAMKSGSSRSGPIDVDLNLPAVTQLFGSVQKVMNQVNSLMVPFLARFGVDESNGMSPLLLDTINSPADIKSIIEDYFRPPTRDIRDFPPADETGDAISADATENSDDDDDDDDDDEVDTPIDNSADTTNKIVNLVSNFIQDTAEINNSTTNDANELNKETETATDDDDNDDVTPTQSFFDVGDCGDDIMAEVKNMLCGDDVSKINEHTMKIMELLDLGKLEGDKGSSFFDYKCKSFQQRWFKKTESKKISEEEMDVDEEDGVFVERESLVVLRCQRGKSVSKENYRVLGSFSKHYKKWYPIVKKHKFQWSRDNQDKDVRFLVSMMVMSGTSWKDYKLEKGGQFGPSCVFRVCTMEEIEEVVGKLDEGDIFSGLC